MQAMSTVRIIRGPTIMLTSGRYFDFEDPGACEFLITDVAHSLSNLCRFTGHCSEFYSVAQHCVLVSYAVPPEHALKGLMHDSAEAFIGDVSKPLKILLPDYAVIEGRVEEAVFSRFGLAAPFPPSIKQGDLTLLRTEQRDVMRADSDVWALANGSAPLPGRIKPLAPEAARREFIRRFEELGGTVPARQACATSNGGPKCLAPMSPKQAEEAFMQRFNELTYA